jgi:hypothetical protein
MFRIFLSGSVLGVLLHLRHILALHASSIKAFHSKCPFHIGAIKYFVWNYNLLKAKAQCQHYIDITTNRPITPLGPPFRAETARCRRNPLESFSRQALQKAIQNVSNSSK